jgi:antitoxin component of MazEF toxin-antitoxin module
MKIRPRNQVTLPQELITLWNLQPDDYLKLQISDDHKVTIFPVRIATEGSPEAREQNREAQADIESGGYRTFADVNSFAESLEEPIEVTVEPVSSMPGAFAKDPLPGLDPSARAMLENLESALLGATLLATKGDKRAAAERLAERLKKMDYHQDFEGVK